MTICVLLCNNSPSVTALRLGDKFDWSMTRGELITQYNTTCYYFYSNYEQTNGIIWWKNKVHNAILQ